VGAVILDLEFFLRSIARFFKTVLLALTGALCFDGVTFSLVYFLIRLLDRSLAIFGISTAFLVFNFAIFGAVGALVLLTPRLPIL